MPNPTSNLKLSIIIPVYNGEKHVGVLLDSLLPQCAGRAIEIIVVNDGSIDNTAMVLTRYSQDYHFLKVFHKPNQGVYPTRNFALEQVQGDYVWMIDADDIVLPGSVDQILHQIEKQPHAQVLGFGYQIENPDRSTTSKVPLITNELISGLEFLATNDGRLFLWSVVYEMEFLSANKLLFPARSHSLEDVYFNIKALALAEKVFCIDKQLYLYRYNANSISKAATLQNRLKQGESSINVHLAILSFRNQFALGSEAYRVINQKLAHSVLGFFYSLLKEDYPFYYINRVYKIYRSEGLLPAKRQNNTLKIKLFQTCVNLKYPFLVLCFLKKAITLFRFRNPRRLPGRKG